MMKPRSAASFAFYAWTGITLLVLSSIAFIAIRWGQVGFELFIQEGVYTHLPTTLAAVACAWLLAGALAYLLFARRIDARNVYSWVGFFMVAFLYLNVLRERFRFGDISYYIEAAASLYNGQPLPHFYFYLPFWATMLEFLVPLGEEAILLFAWCLNFLSTLAFYFLLHKVLERYGFSPRLAAAVTAGFMLVNTPLLRSLVYVQVNLHVMNAVFLSLLLFRRRPVLSALFLALAVQLKTSPAVLVLAFLLERDWRWLAWFIAGNLLLGSVTLLVDGVTPFLDVLENVTRLGTAGRTAVFHDNSFDSFFGFPSQVFAVSGTLVRLLVYAAKGLLAAGSLAVLARLVKTRAFYADTGRGGRLFNALPPLFVLMTMAAPVVWVHHGVFLSIAYLVLLIRLNTSGAWYLFGLAYLLQFALPTFDFYPWSYGRMLSPLICLWLLWQHARPGSPAATFLRLNRGLDMAPPHTLA